MNRAHRSLQVPEYDKWVGLGQAWHEFKPAFKTAWPYTLVGLCFGLVIFALQHHLEASPPQGPTFGTRLLEHLAIGFWVSAIAVFFYEWGAHIKKALALTERLVDVYMEQRKVLSAEGEKALSRSLLALFKGDESKPPEHMRRAASRIRGIVLTIAALEREGIWASAQYIDFISYLLKGVGRNAESLRNLDRIGDKHLIVHHIAAELADRILTAQMKAMNKGDRYEVISDLTSWQRNQLPKFRKETQKATGRGVMVKRVFNLYREIPESMTLGDIRNILTIHLQDTERNYEVRVLGLDARSKNDLKFPDGRTVGEAHFGLFKYRDRNKEGVVRFDVTMTDLSDMSLCKERAVFKDELKMFDDVWVAATRLDGSVIDSIIESIRHTREANSR